MQVREARQPPARTVRAGALSDVALREAWGALWVSRLLTWAAGLAGVAVLGFDSAQRRPESVRAFGSLGNALIAPLTGWDANSYVQIAAHGYQNLFVKAFFPLYPLLVHVAAWVLRSDWAAAAIVSLVSLFGALYLLHRLVTLELGERYARSALLLMAFTPMAVFFSAAYTESLFLLLTIGGFYAARRERWPLAAALGVLAAMTRNSGVLLIIPLAWLYLYGPRARERTDVSKPASKLWRTIRPRYGVDATVMFPFVVVLGLGLVLAYMGTQGDALAPLHAVQRIWHRHAIPLGGVVNGVPLLFDSVRQLITGAGHLPVVPGGEFTANAVARYNLVDWLFLVLAAIAIVGVLRRLPVAYGLYSMALLIVSASAYIGFEPLISLPRYVSVIFPCYMWLAAWSIDRRRFQPALGSSIVLLIIFSAQFATWRWVA